MYGGSYFPVTVYKRFKLTERQRSRLERSWFSVVCDSYWKEQNSDRSRQMLITARRRLHAASAIYRHINRRR